MRRFIWSTFACFLAINLVNCNNILVEIEDGKLLGTLSSTVSGREYSSFKGIPYAEPPVSLVFRLQGVAGSLIGHNFCLVLLSKAKPKMYKLCYSLPESQWDGYFGRFQLPYVRE